LQAMHYCEIPCRVPGKEQNYSGRTYPSNADDNW
jgi:hypothetical protein